MLLNSCGGRSGYFKMEGHLLNMNQAEFYIYSPDGIVNGIDTIKMFGGRFSHEIPCEEEGLIMLVFPNFSEQPIFAEPGKSVELQGTASHLKELKVKGTKNNELMNRFRMTISNASPADLRKEIAQFILDNPESPVSRYVFRRYFILEDKPDFTKGQELLKAMKEAQEDKSAITKLEMDFAEVKASAVGQRLPTFSGNDINGTKISNANIKGSVAVIYTWASWSHESMERQQNLRLTAKKHAGQLKLIGINLDAGKKICLKTIERDSITTPTICDEKVFENPLLSKLGMKRVPDNLIISKEGQILEHGLSTKELKEKLEKLLK